MSVYSEAHPAVTALKKRIAATEKSLTQTPPASAGNQSADEIETLKRQREILEKSIADANAKLAAARMSEKLDRDQQSDSLQVIEAPQLPQVPLKSPKVKIAGTGLALALVLGLAAVTAREMLDGSIRNRDQLSGLVNRDMVVLIPYMTTRGDLVRARWRKVFVVLTVALILSAWAALAIAILFRLPVDIGTIFHVAQQTFGRTQE